MIESGKLLKEISTRLQLIREKLRYLQKDFANELEISNASLSEMESGNVKLRFELIYNITRKFNVNINYLLHGKGPMFLPGGIFSMEEVEIGEDSLAFLQEFLQYFNKSSLIRSSVMNHFRTYLLNNREIIEKDILEKDMKLKAMDPAAKKLNR
jgi:transcriptional regulator with XRE-family HTH domain